MNLLAFVAVLCCMEPPLIFPPTGIYARPVEKAEPVEEKPVSKGKVRYFTAPYCGYCVSFDKAGGVEKLKAAGYEVEKIDIQANPEWAKYVGGLPTFWLDHPIYEEPFQIMTGNHPADQLIRRFDERMASVAWTRELVEEPGKQTLPFGNTGSSHESRESLIRHLLNDGVHKGKRTKEQLDKMTDLQLDQLHHLDHVVAAKAKATKKPRR